MMALIKLSVALFLLAVLLSWYMTRPAVEWIQHEVREGETLWRLALRYCPNITPQEVIWHIRHRNGITPAIYPGQIILIMREVGQ